MPTHSSDSGADDAAECRVDDLERYADFHLGDGVVIIYDTRNEEAWIQSETSRPLASMA